MKNISKGKTKDSGERKDNSRVSELAEEAVLKTVECKSFEGSSPSPAETRIRTSLIHRKEKI